MPAPAESAAALLDTGYDDQKRNYVSSGRQEYVENHYRLNHTHQTLRHVLERKEEDRKREHKVIGFWEVMDMLEDCVDTSDPDTGLPQSQHAFQTAEALRKEFPDARFDWLHLVGLLHDMGKMLVKQWGQPWWDVGGDTFPVGCKFSDKVVFSDLFKLNPDSEDSLMMTEHGIYEPHCGFENVHFAWGHDEYMAKVLERSSTSLPPIAIYIVRFHSFYAWHQDGAYSHLANDRDLERVAWLRAFQRCDLYSKVNETLDLPSLKPYYASLVTKYLNGGKLVW
mmetsp:Transcript_28864/g.74029  ORF Transcript_28864/g.74029 Transcript_28864/m.74029 type:complete len:281 (-) Transcript_28864:354-1196(-)